MQTTYIPNDLGYSENGYPMEREKFNVMVKEIFANGRVSNVHVHGYGQMYPGEEMKHYFEFSKAVEVIVSEPIEIKYTVHINKLNPIRVIEEI
jgi:hypothetical protein